MVGDLKRWTARGQVLPAEDDLSYVDVCDLSPEVIKTLRPEVVMSPLVVREFDVIDIARRLVEIGFAGRYRAVVQKIPDISLIAADVRAVAPALDFDVIDLPEGPDAP